MLYLFDIVKFKIKKIDRKNKKNVINNVILDNVLK